MSADHEPEEVTVVVHPGWAALTLLAEADDEHRDEHEARELREDAARLAGAIEWCWSERRSA